MFSEEYVTMKFDMDWLKNIKEDTARFIESITEGNYQYFKYSYSGDILDSSVQWGLANFVFAVKILYVTKLLQQIDDHKKNNLYYGIMKFADDQGYIYDPYLTRLSFKQKIKQRLGRLDRPLQQKIEEIRRAETRQSLVALHLLGQKPSKPFLAIPDNKEAIDKYLTALNWEYPWAAASHFSHLLFFLKYNNIFFDLQNNNKELIQHAVQRIHRIQSEKDGCWYVGDHVSLAQKINGALKVLTGLHAAGIDKFPHAHQLIDTCLTGINDDEACSNFNIAYVLYACKKVDDNYRDQKIKEFLATRLNLYKEYYHASTGGFSFFKDKANMVYYGKQITKGRNEPDIHGTNMFLTGIAVINEALNLELDLQVPVN